VIKIHFQNNFAHELAKFLICWQLSKEGKEFVTEAIFNNGRRADILVLDSCDVIEILHSESEDKCLAKTEEYPVPRTNIIMLNAKEVIRNDPNIKDWM
jgi:hypothetical protein